MQNRSEVDDIVPVFVTDDVMEARVIKDVLDSEGIPAQVDSWTQGGLTRIDQVHVLVHSRDFERARAVIERRGEDAAQA